MLVLLICLAMALTAATAGAKTKVNITSWGAAGTIAFDWQFKKYSDIINAAAAGQFDFKIHPSNTLVPLKDVYQALTSGIVGMSPVWVPAHAGVFPLIEMFQLPGLSPNQSVSNKAVNALFDRYPQFEAEIDPALKHLSTQIHMGADLHSRVPIRTLADLKGKTIGCQTKSAAEALKTLGAGVAVMSNADAYAALERGVIDGTVLAWGAVQIFRIYEVANYHTLLGIAPGVSYWLANREQVWDKLSEEQKGLIMNIPSALQDTMTTSNILQVLNMTGDVVTPANGHEIITWPEEDMKKMRTTFKPFWDKWVSDMEKKGYPAREILETTLTLIDAYKYN